LRAGEPPGEEAIDSSLGDMKEAPTKEVEEKERRGGTKKYKVAVLEPDDAMVIPCKGGEGVPLKRIFLGLGWTKSLTQMSKVDVDCVCAPYSQGVRNEADTVGFFNLNSTTNKRRINRKQTEVCHIKHSGDVLVGQGSDEVKELGDMERIYVDLENMPMKYDCIAFEANVFTKGCTFANLGSCYVRLVNADTNQELVRCDITNSTELGKAIMSQRVLLLAKLMRSSDRWVLHACTQPRKEELRKLSGPQPEFSCSTDIATTAPSVAVGVPNPMAEKDRPGAEATPGKRDTRASKPKRAFMIGAVAVGTAAGCVAAMALFKPEALSAAAMGAGDMAFEVGDMLTHALPTNCGCLSDFKCCGQCNIGDTLGTVYDFGCGGCCKQLGLPNCLAPCKELGNCFGSVFGVLGDVAAQGIDCCGDCVGNIPGGGDIMKLCECSACGDIAGSLFGVVGDGCGQIIGCAGGLIGPCTDILGDCVGNLGPLLEGVGQCAGSCCEVIGPILNALLP